MSKPSTKTPVPLDELITRAEGYANFAMRRIGHVPPALLADSPTGSIHFIPDSLADERAKNSFANAAKLICIAHEVTAAVLVLESWMKVANPGESLDSTEPPSESFDRREVVIIMGEAPGLQKPKFLPIIRTDAGGFFGFGEYEGPKLDGFQGRFAQLLPPSKPNAELRTMARAMLSAMGVTDQALRCSLEGN